MSHIMERDSCEDSGASRGTKGFYEEEECDLIVL